MDSFHSWLGGLPGVCSRGVLQLSWNPNISHTFFVRHLEVGLYRGPYFAALELQGRWACGVFSQRLNELTEASPVGSGVTGVWGLHGPQKSCRGDFFVCFLLVFFVRSI